MKFFIELVSRLRLDAVVSYSAIHLYLFARNVSELVEYPVNSSQGMWLFCALFLVCKVAFDGCPAELQSLKRFRDRFYENYAATWAEMEHFYLRKINFALCDFVYRVQLFDADRVRALIDHKERDR